jgi:hypothetical protein
MAKRKAAGNPPNPATQPEAGASLAERDRMIAEAAYFRALARGFQGGDPIDDWLAAEREINRLLPSPQQQKQELAAYEKLRQGVGKILSETRETLSADTIRHALAQAKTQLKSLGEHTADTVDRVAASVEKDMVHAVQRMGPKWEAFSEKTADLFHVWRDRGSQFLGRASAAAGEWLQQATGHLKAQTYRSGEMTAAGELVCTNCGETVQLATPAHVPLCPTCRGSEFRRKV